MLSEWPVRIENNQLLVEGALNGQPARIMLDTGVPRTQLNSATATRLNAARQEFKRDRKFGASGESNVEIALLDEFRVVDFKRSPWRMVISGDRDLSVDVLLGEDFLSLVDLEFDLEHNVVRLFQPENCDGKNLAYWASDGQSVGEVPIDPIVASQPQIVLDVRVNGKTIGALLDSGAPSSVLDKPAASRLGATPESPGVMVVGPSSGAGGKSLPVWSAPFQSFTIGTETAKTSGSRFPTSPARRTRRSAAEFRQGGTNAADAAGCRLPALAPSVGLAAPEAHVLHAQRRTRFRFVTPRRHQGRRESRARREALRADKLTGG